MLPVVLNVAANGAQRFVSKESICRTWRDESLHQELFDTLASPRRQPAEAEPRERRPHEVRRNGRSETQEPIVQTAAA